MADTLVRLATAADTEQVRALWSYCFRDGEAFEDWFFAERYRPEQTLLVARGADVLAMTHLLPYDISVRGRAFRARYVVGVASWPWERGQGHAGRLLRAAVDQARAQGASFLPLYPFAYAMYERYGWAICYEAARCDVPLQDIGFVPEGVRLAPVCGGSGQVLLAAAYDAAMAGLSGYVLRDEATWARRFSQMAAEGGRAVAALFGDRPVGGMIYHQEEDCLVADELYYETQDALRALLGFLGAHSSTAKRARWEGPVGRPSWRQLPDARGQVSLMPHAMQRLADVHAAFSLAQPDAPPVTLRVVDDKCPWNDGVFRLEDGRAERCGEAAQASVCIGALTQWALGYADPVQSAASGMLSADGWVLEALQRRYPLAQTALVEMW